MLAFRYIGYHYLKYFLVILLALTLFTVGFDYMQMSDRLPQSANLILLYLMYRAFFAIGLLLPLSLVFAMIAAKIYLIRSNSLVAFYSLGYSKTDVMKPFVLIASIIITVYVALHMTSFARADEYSANIRDTSQLLTPTENLFFTFEDKYIYFGKLYPLQERADDIRIFRVNNDTLEELLVASGAYYSEGYWHITQAHHIVKPKRGADSNQGIVVNEEKELKLLKGFRPKILDQVYEGKVNFTILDAIDALILFTDEDINIDKIKSALYRIFITPLFVPSLIVIIFFFVPISSRFLNVTLFSFGAILATLLVWALLFILTELSNTKTIPSEVGIVLPTLILFFISIFQWQRNRVKS